ncbi:MAG TPA: hypothetical protein VF545_04765 [Thermoleophilaceae bacterium]
MSSATKLLYALATQPSPLQASPAHGELVQCVLTVEASNPAPDPDANPVTLAGVEIKVPIGEAAADLTPDATSIGPLPPPGWQLQTNTAPGVYAFVPVGPPGTTVSVGSQALMFGLEAVPVNRAPGPVAGLQVIEGTPGMPSVQLPLTKFPNGWGSVDFWACRPDIRAGQSTTLHWSGPAGATYTIEYAAGDEVVNLPPAGQPRFANAGVWPGAHDPPLEPAETTVFTMTVDDTIGGEQYSTRVQTTVTVVEPGPKIQQFAGAIVAAGGGYDVVFEWVAANAGYCTLSAVPEAELQTKAGPPGYALPIDRPLTGTYVLDAIHGAASASSTLQALWAVRSVTPLPAACDPPMDLALAPDGALLYVAGGQSMAAYVTPASAGDPLPEPVVQQMGGVVGPATRLAAARSDGAELVVALRAAGAGLDFSGMAALEFLGGEFSSALDWTIPAESATDALAATPDGSQLYPVAGGVIWGQSFSMGTLPTLEWMAGESGVTAVAASGDGWLYTGAAGAVTAQQVGDSGLTPGAALSLPGQTVVDLALAGETLFVALGQEIVAVDRSSMQQLGDPLPIVADAIAVSPDGLRLYALVISAQSVYVISPTPLTGGVSG